MDDVRSLLELFKVRAGEQGESSTGKMEVSIFPEDLPFLKMDYGRCCEILGFLKVCDIEVLREYEEDDFRGNNKEGDAPRYFDIALPLNFGKHLKEIYSEAKKQFVLEEAGAKFEFDNGVVRYGRATYSFHMNLKKKNSRLDLFKKLWDDRSHIQKGRIRHKGKLQQDSHLATILGITSEANSLSRNKILHEEFYNIVKGINRDFRKNGIPAKISVTNKNLQLV